MTAALSALSGCAVAVALLLLVLLAEHFGRREGMGGGAPGAPPVPAPQQFSGCCRKCQSPASPYNPLTSIVSIATTAPNTCDYAVCASTEEDEGEGIPMMAAVAAKSRLAEYARIFSQAGLRRHPPGKARPGCWNGR